MFKELTPDGWKPAIGYANGIAARGEQLFIGGQIGWDSQQQFQTDDLVEQIQQTLQNIADILAQGNAGPEHMVRMTWYIVDKHEYLAKRREIGQVYRTIMGRNFPAMTLIQVADLLEDRAKVEIEVTAVIPD
jgi:enamine deaminase RidA (YjgF/YER057c/UK114 family)